MQRLRGALGLPERATPHAFPSFLRVASALPMAAICARCRRLLGHASLSTTQTYTENRHQNSSLAVYNAAHPRAR